MNGRSLRDLSLAVGLLALLLQVHGRREGTLVSAHSSGGQIELLILPFQCASFVTLGLYQVLRFLLIPKILESLQEFRLVALDLQQRSGTGLEEVL